jgi:hypothetical protein
MCSDGVSGMIPEQELRAAVNTPDLTAIAASLIGGTRAGGAEDNFSFVILDIPDLEVTDTGPVQAVAATPQAPPGYAPGPPPAGPPGGRPPGPPPGGRSLGGRYGR